MNDNKFFMTSVVVWQGVITTYGCIKHLIEKSDIEDVVSANEEEKKRYFSRPEK